ncbi:hypothetical protein PG994_015356 [Apiospora phragmitis]|uniref:Uncharacterized protein n=1 Tax=Apiospora phragmitis TaxID=2905665 RepID=A0ABR1ST16_9PEZI
MRNVNSNASEKSELLRREDWIEILQTLSSCLQNVLTNLEESTQATRPIREHNKLTDRITLCDTQPAIQPGTTRIPKELNVLVTKTSSIEPAHISELIPVWCADPAQFFRPVPNPPTSHSFSVPSFLLGDQEKAPELPEQQKEIASIQKRFQMIGVWMFHSICNYDDPKMASIFPDEFDYKKFATYEVVEALEKRGIRDAAESFTDVAKVLLRFLYVEVKKYAFEHVFIQLEPVTIPCDRKRKRRRNGREPTIGLDDSSTWDTWRTKWLETTPKHAADGGSLAKDPAILSTMTATTHLRASNDGHGDDNYSDLVEWDPDYIRSDHRHHFPRIAEYIENLVAETKNLDFAKLSRAPLALDAIIRGGKELSLREHPKSSFKAKELEFPQHLSQKFDEAMKKELVRLQFF